MSYRLLHIMPDEKVIDTFVSLMEEVYPGESLFAVYGKSPEPQRVQPSPNVVYFRLGSRAFRHFLRNTSSFSRVILHSVDTQRDLLALRHPDITGLFWGADLYESLLAHKGFKIYIDEEAVWRVRAGKIPIFLYKAAIAVRDNVYYRRERSLLNRLSRLGAQSCDRELFYQYFPQYHFKTLTPGFTYYPIEKMIDPTQMDSVCSGSNIWVNNSPAPNGNHVSVYQLLSSFTSNFKVITPLSYGDPRFMRYFEEQGRALLGDRFVPLLEFLPHDQYYSLFLSANSFIFGHLRQCGYGNVLVSLYFGAKCFFYKKNPLFEELKRRSFVVFSIEDDLTETFAMTPLPELERKHNRETVMRSCAREVVLKGLELTFKQ